MQTWYAELRRVENIPYSEFQVMLEEGRLESIGVPATSIRGKLKFPTAQGREYMETVRIDRAFDRATSILQSHRQLLDDTAKKLLEKETLTADELPTAGELHDVGEEEELRRRVG